MFNKKSLKVNFLLAFLLALLLFSSLDYAQPINPEYLNYAAIDTTAEIPTQYRRGIELQPGFQSYEEKYFGKNLSEEKRRLFPLQSTGVWTELNPKVPRVDYLGINFVNKDTGWACGQSGAVIKTMDGGSTWTISNTQVNNLLLKIHSYTGQIVLVTGYDGIILRSSDEGETFEQVTSGVGNGYDLWGVQMLNDTLGFVCGLNHTLLKTTDAGLMWQPINAGLNQHYWSLDFLNEQYGMIACSGGKILKTTDGGNNWIQIQAGDTRALYTIDIIDSLHIAAGGGSYGKNVYSSDGGLSWIQNADLIYENGVNSIAFISTDTGYAVGENWALRKTTNRGINWFASNPIYGEWQLDLLEIGVGYATGNELRIYKTTGGYDNWEKLFFTDNLNDVFFTNESNGFIIVSDPPKLYKTIDGGQSWDSIPGAPGGTNLLFLDSLTGFIGSNLIYKTIDGGVTWYVPNGGQGGAGKIFFINQLIGWAIRSNVIYKTTDRGEIWFSQFTAPNNFTSIFFIDNLNGWATSRYVWQTTNGGQNWIQRTDIPIFLPDDVYFSNLDTGWVGRYSSINKSLFRTTDGGVNWIGIPEVIGARKFYFFPDPIHWLTIGFSRYYITNDFGNTWLEFTGEVPAGLVSFYAPNDKLGYAIGTLGLILRYDDTTYIPVEFISFEGKMVNNEMILSWVTASELNNFGFYVERSCDYLSWETIGFVNGNGTTTNTNYYNFIDHQLIHGQIFYRLKQADYNGTFAYSEVIEMIVPIKEFRLMQNFPNPVNPSTNISFSVPVLTKVKIDLYSIGGELVKEIVNEERDIGEYYISVNLNELAAGVYFYRMTTNKGYSNVKKLILLK